MQLLLSCAKTMTERSSVPTPRTTRPAYRSEAAELAAGLATLPTDELARLLRVNRRIAAENRLRYGRFHGDDDAAIPALTAYTGIVFKRIDPASFTDADFEYAQRHLNITSFLYGLLTRWTPSAPTGSKATPYCPAAATKRCFPTGKAG